MSTACIRCGVVHDTYRDARRCFDEYEASLTPQERLRRRKESEAFVGVFTDKLEEGLARFDQAMADAFPDEDEDARRT